MDYVEFYKDCDSLLHKLMTTEYAISYNEICEISPNYANFIIREFAEKGIAQKDFMRMLTVDRVKAGFYLDTRYYERKTDEALANRKRDELFERSTISAEESAKWAKESSEAAKQSAGNSKKANLISLLAIAISVIAIVISLLDKCSSN